MTVLAHPLPLRNILKIDAALSAVTAVTLLAGTHILAPVLGLETAFLRGAGLLLLPFILLVMLTARSDRPDETAVRLVVACNLAWSIVSIALLFSTWIEPSSFGIVFIVVQAVIVAVFAEVQIIGLRKSAV